MLPSIIRLLVAVALFIGLVCCFPLFPGFRDDMNCWAYWSTHILKQGLRNTYDSGTNYLPVYQYVLWLFAKLCRTQAEIESNIAYIRIFTLMFDFAGLYFISKWIGKEKHFLTLLLISIINISYLYNTVIWGQVDGILAALVFIALYLVWNEYFLLSGVCIAVALLFKLQSIIFLPLWGLLLLLRFRNFKVLIMTLLMVISTAVIVLLPFYLRPGGVLQVYKVFTGYVDFMPRLSLNAANLWPWVTNDYPGNVPEDTIWFAQMTYKQVGLLFFFVSSLVALFPLVYVIVKRMAGMRLQFHKESVWLIAALLALLFFYFNTQMHERYSHPAFIFITAYSFYKKDFFPYILFSIAYFLNLEGGLRWLALENYDTVIFNQRFISAIYLATIVLLFVRLFANFKSLIGKQNMIETI